jgi:hypothetical protein
MYNLIMQVHYFLLPGAGMPQRLSKALMRISAEYILLVAWSCCFPRDEEHPTLLKSVFAPRVDEGEELAGVIS